VEQHHVEEKAREEEPELEGDVVLFLEGLEARAEALRRFRIPACRP
jgi:hypothetical protein